MDNNICFNIIITKNTIFIDDTFMDCILNIEVGNKTILTMMYLKLH